MRVVISNEPSQTAGFISWKRLAEELRASGEIQPKERVVAFEVSENGINYFVTRRDEQK